MIQRRAILAAPMLAVPALASAQSWPSRPVRIVLAYPPGGSTDVLARELKDLRVFLEVNLNAQAVGPAAPVGEKLAVSIANIRSSADRVSLELKDLAASLATERTD